MARPRVCRRVRGGGFCGGAASCCPCCSAHEGKYQAMFDFGDSLVDASNLVTEGIPDYHFGYPTGRCFDGCLVIDFHW
uniref:Uncharacterized protein n=1 Tax=Oryza punctata TaxID=4537 RepID=A0A0E0KE00_ORYPU